MLDDSWSNIEPMMTFRHALAVASFEQFVYVIGGWIDGSKCSNSVERYDISCSSSIDSISSASILKRVGDLKCNSHQWQMMSPLLLARRLLGAATYAPGRAIFVFGGQCDDPDW